MSTEIGRQAEQAAANYLLRQGYTVVAQNWRTRWCEIDLIITKGATVLFVEVKYRRSAAFGSGLDYITAQKLRQMHYAAEFWLASHRRGDVQYGLAAIELTGPTFEVTAWLDDVA